jgi:hypothetical protein
VAEQGSSVVPFWVAYAAAAAVAACWCASNVRHLQVGRHGRADGRSHRVAIAMAAPGLVIVGVGLVRAFAGLGLLQALVFGAVAGFLLSMMLVYGALVLRDRRRSRI